MTRKLAVAGGKPPSVINSPYLPRSTVLPRSITKIGSAVSNHNACPACHDTLQRVLDQGFGFAVEVTGGFVKNEAMRYFPPL